MLQATVRAVVAFPEQVDVNIQGSSGLKHAVSQDGTGLEHCVGCGHRTRNELPAAQLSVHTNLP